MRRVVFYALSDEQVASSRSLRKNAFRIILAAIAVFAGMVAAGSGVFGTGLRETIGRELAERIIFSAAIVGLLAFEVVLFAWRRLYIDRKVRKGEFPDLNGIFVVLMIFNVPFIVLAIMSFQRR